MDQRISKQHSYLTKYARVPSKGKEWNDLEYKLQIALASSTVVCKNIYSISNPNISLNFDKKNKGLLILDSWLDINRLNESNSPDKVCQRGFEFSSGGLIFPTGHITLDQDNYKTKNRVHELFVVRAAVGRPYSVAQKNLDRIRDKRKLPQGFDSVYILYEDEDEPQVYKNDYIIYENSQVLPMYVIHFEFDPKKEEELSAPICDLCQENQATVYCKNEDANLCFDCDEDHHLKIGRLAAKHQRVPINERPKQFGKCQQHPECTLEFYCPVDNEPLCVYCKISGTHSGGEKVDHPIIKISEAYTKALVESKEKDPILEKRKSALTDLLNNIDSTIKEINENATEVEEQIYQLLQEALRMLHEETQKKLSFLIADQVEIKRQYEQISWIQNFLRYQMDILNPADYLNTWSKFLLLKNDLINLTPVPTPTNIQPDMRVDGKINVIANTKIRSAIDEDVGYNDPNGLDQLGDPSSANKFKANIFKKIGAGGPGLNSSNASVLKGYSTLKSPIPMSATKISPPQGNDPFTKSLQTRADFEASSILLPEETMKYLNFAKPTGLQPRANEWEGNLQQKANPGQGNTISLKAEARRRLIHLENQPLWGKQQDNFLKDVFKDSRILERDERENLYLNIPFTGINLPNVNQLYQIEPTSERPDIRELFKKHPYPNVILFQVGNKKFGGYASQPWIFKKNQPFFGDMSCFLFSITEDVKLLPKGQDSEFLWLGPSSFSFGSTDLHIEDNWKDCKTEIECDYTTGLSLTKDQTKTYLAGKEEFSPDLIEIYTIEPK